MKSAIEDQDPGEYLRKGVLLIVICVRTARRFVDQEFCHVVRRRVSVDVLQPSAVNRFPQCGTTHCACPFLLFVPCASGA